MPPGCDGGFQSGAAADQLAITASFRCRGPRWIVSQAPRAPGSTAVVGVGRAPARRPVASSANPASVEHGGAASITPPAAKPQASPDGWVRQVEGRITRQERRLEQLLWHRARGSGSECVPVLIPVLGDVACARLPSRRRWVRAGPTSPVDICSPPRPTNSMIVFKFNYQPGAATSRGIDIVFDSHRMWRVMGGVRRAGRAGRGRRVHALGLSWRARLFLESSAVPGELGLFLESSACLSWRLACAWRRALRRRPPSR